MVSAVDAGAAAVAAPGLATAAGTGAFRARHAGVEFRAFGPLWASSVGWGTSRGEGDESARAMAHAYARGVNVFDLVPYCRGGAAERAMAQALGEGLSRASVVLMSRVGFLPEPVGGFGEHVRRVEERYVARGLFAWGDLALGQHCLAPAFVREAVEASVRRLGTGLDVAFVDSPAAQRAIAGERELEGRIRAAFEQLEALVAEGKVGCYGVANPGECALERLLALAEQAGGAGHHLRAVQFPLSLRASGAQLRATQPLGAGTAHVLRAARELGLYAFASGALAGGAVEYEMAPEAREQLGAVVTDAQVGLQWARSMPGVGTVLCGMRRAAHVEENCAVGALAPAGREVAEAFLPEGVEA